jgi:hypothetical protein
MLKILGILAAIVLASFMFWAWLPGRLRRGRFGIVAPILIALIGLLILVLTYLHPAK